MHMKLTSYAIETQGDEFLSGIFFADYKCTWLLWILANLGFLKIFKASNALTDQWKKEEETAMHEP